MQTSLGTAIRSLRSTAGLTIAEASEIAGVAPSYLSRAENGLVAPTPSWVHNYVAAIGDRIEADAKATA